jgi:DNA repair exonuclease SbcCD ATPase subunit
MAEHLKENWMEESESLKHGIAAELWDELGLSDKALLRDAAQSLGAQYCCPVCKQPHRDHRECRTAATQLLELKHGKKQTIDLMHRMAGLTDEELDRIIGDGTGNSDGKAAKGDSTSQE